MSVLDRKLRRDLAAAKGMLAAIIAILVLGVSLFVAMAGVYVNLQQSRRDYYARCRMADFSVTLKKLPLSELHRIAEVRGVTEVRPRIVFNVIIDLDGFEQPVSGQVLSLPDAPAPVINSIVLKRGGYFTDQKREEVIVSDAFARAHRIRPGDRIRMILNNRKEQLTVVGTAISSEYVYLIAPGSLVPDAKTYGIFYLKRSYAEEVFEFDGACNQVVGLLGRNFRGNPDEVLRQIETELEPFGVATTTPRSRMPSPQFLSSQLALMRVTVFVLPSIFLVVAALILNILMMRIAEQQRTVVGTLKALGYSNRMLFGHYIRFGLTVGLAGGILGAIAGYGVAGLMMLRFRQFYEFPDLPNRPHYAAMMLGVVVGIAFAVLGTLRGVRAVLKLVPAEAMRPTPPRRGRRVFLEAWPWFWKRLDFRTKMVIRGIFRQRMRTAVTAGSAVVGTALMLVSFQMRDAMYEMVRFQFDKVLRADFELAFTDEKPYAAVFDVANSLPSVDALEPVFVVPCTLENGHFRKQTGITGVTADARLTGLFRASGERVDLPPAGLVLTKKLAELLHVRAGQFLTVIPGRGRRDRLRVPVAAIVDSYLGIAAYADFHYLNRLVGEESSVTGVRLKVHPGREETRDLYRRVKQMPVIQAVNAIRDQKRNMNRVFVEEAMISTGTILLFAGLIFFASILNASLISLAERQQEIAVMRVLGYGPKEVGSLFLRENLILNGIGIAIGLPTGYVLARLLVQVYDTELFRIPFNNQPQSWVLTAAFGVLFALLAHRPVQRAVARQDWVRALNVKE